MINWHNLHHSELTVTQLYAVLQLRCAVFVVEQNCVYQDVDGEDLQGNNRHILGFHGGELVAYARILHSDNQLEPVVIGRVIVSSQLRGKQVGEQLMQFTLQACQRQWPDKSIYLGAQAHLQCFYQRFGFSAVTPEYDEDGILHIGMAREPLSEVHND
ncbi:GNAT family N-acetyltransferase [Citrobacter sp. JGM124]|uniref:GNAT family N-acetyltransferase n=1 Tax=Citrobacter sp. JGM124 TaxID=2799789 RepID=UPI001BA5FFDA|nr:GNAT family N-acetyltransferase [Citrobacter sp. JGM124]MBS0846836.1 GNAT family N-acetyltransferase [Citrobacter sp. JGM124]